MIEQLLSISKHYPLKSFADTKDWAKDYYHYTQNELPFKKALIGGFMSQQFSFAFMSGYQAALEKMFPNIAPNELKALCVSEKKGGHPKTMETTLIDNRVNGLKTYVTAGTDVAHLLVQCKTEKEENGRPLFKIVHIPSTAKGIEITNFELPMMKKGEPMMKEVKHGKLLLNNTEVRERQILEGNGYVDFTKPFRTLEDIHVGVAYQAMLLRQAIEYNWDADLRDQLLLNLHTLKYLDTLPPSAKETHLLLTANDQNFEDLQPTINENLAKHAPFPFKENWALNKRIIFMSEKLKATRLEKAR